MIDYTATNTGDPYFLDIMLPFGWTWSTDTLLTWTVNDTLDYVVRQYGGLMRRLADN